jgi:hypothetical protein
MGGSSSGFERARSRPANVIKGAKKESCHPKARCSPQRLARRLASPFFLQAASPYHEVFTVARQANANSACAEAEAARPGEG